MRSKAKALLLLGLFALGLLALSRPARAMDVDIDPSGTVQYFGSRKVLLQSTWGLYWVFYQDANGNFAYDTFDKSGNEFSQGTVITTTTVGGSVYASIWHVESSSDVYIVAANGGVDTVLAANSADGVGGNNNDDWYIFRYRLSSNGTLSLQNSRTIGALNESCSNFSTGANDRFGDHFTKSPGGIVYFDSSNGIGAVVGAKGNSTNAANVFGAFGITGMNVTNLSGGTPFCMGDAASAVNPTNEIVTAVPIKDGATWKVLNAYRSGGTAQTANNPFLDIADDNDMAAGGATAGPPPVDFTEKSTGTICANDTGCAGASLQGTGAGWSL
jgi:hypothetical protein